MLKKDSEIFKKSAKTFYKKSAFLDWNI